MAHLTDEEILGLGVEEPGAAPAAGGARHGAQGSFGSTGDAGLQDERAGAAASSPELAPRPPAGAEHPAQAVPDAGRQVGTASGGQPSEAQGNVATLSEPPEELKALFADPKIGPKLEALWEQHQAYTAIFPRVEEARALRQLFPGGAEEGRQALARAQEADQIDDAYFSADAATQAQLAQYLFRTNPHSFQMMLAQAGRVLAERDPAGYGEFLRSLRSGGLKSVAAQGEAAREAVRAEVELERDREELSRERQELTRAQQDFRAAVYTAFEKSANDAVLAQVQQAIEQTLGGVLPEEVPEGARKRIGENILYDVHVTLQDDAGLRRQVSALLRAWKFDDETRQQVVNLIFARARAVIPAVTKRVVGEWTSSVLTSSRQKASKQQAAASRVDIAAGGAQETLPKRSLTPREIDYSKLTDEQILGL